MSGSSTELYSGLISILKCYRQRQQQDKQLLQEQSNYKRKSSTSAYIEENYVFNNFTTPLGNNAYATYKGFLERTRQH